MQGGQPSDCMTTAQEWWASVPFGVKGLFVITIGLYALDWPFNGAITYILADIPILTFSGQVWRVFFAQFVHGGLLNLLFSLMTIYGTAIGLENQIGSITFLIDVMLKNFLMQILYLAVCGLLSSIFAQALIIPSYGLWNLAMVYISLRSFSRPDEDTQFLCFPIAIKNKYYPIAIVAFVNLMAFPRFDLLAGVLLGYFEFKFFNGMLFRPTQGRVGQLANSFLFRGVVDRPDFVPYDGRLNTAQEFQARPINNPQQQQQAKPPQQVREFGGKGVTIGTDIYAPAQGPKVYPQSGFYEMNQTGMESANSNEQTETEAQKQQKKKNNYDNFGDELV